MGTAESIITIAAALIDDESGRLLLVRKRGTDFFMQAGGKIEHGETALSALRRELEEEIGLAIDSDEIRYLGRFSAPAANEVGCEVEAEVFHVRTDHSPATRHEIEEALWITRDEAETLPLAPLTRDYIVPLSKTL